MISRWIFNQCGFLNRLGFIDFAGGTTIFLSSGITVFIVSLFTGGVNLLKEPPSTKY